MCNIYLFIQNSHKTTPFMGQIKFYFQKKSTLDLRVDSIKTIQNYFLKHQITVLKHSSVFQ